MSADNWEASARREAGAVHRPSRTVFEAVELAGVAAAFVVVLARARAEVVTRAVRPPPALAADVAATAVELQATTPANSTTEPAKSARIPIAYRSIPCAACWFAPDDGARAAEQSSDSYISTLCHAG
jgi:hypothetical protein